MAYNPNTPTAESGYIPPPPPPSDTGQEQDGDDISSWSEYADWGDKAFLLQTPEELTSWLPQDIPGGAQETILYWLLGGVESDNDPNIPNRLLEGYGVWDEIDSDRKQDLLNIINPITNQQLDALAFGEYSGQIGSYQQGKLPELKELARGVGSGMKGGITGSAKRRETAMGAMGGEGYLEGLTGIYGNIQGQQTMAASDIDNTIAGWLGGISALGLNT